MLRYFRFGEVPALPQPEQQVRTLKPLARFLELEGWTTTVGDVGVLRCQGASEMIIGVYPALLSLETAQAVHPVATGDGARRVLLPDYLVEHDLPSAYQRSINASSSTSATTSSSARVSVPSSGQIFELPAKDLKSINDAGKMPTVRLRSIVDPGAQAFAVRVPQPGLTSTGFASGKWLVARPSRPDDLGSDAWQIVLRLQGTFGATGRDWTIAHVKELPGADEEPTRFQVSYGSATEKKFRPERLHKSEALIVATIVCHADEAP